MAREPLITHIYTADPSAHVFEGRIHLYASHDLDQEMVEDDTGDQFLMTDYHVFTMESPLGPATDHGEAIHIKDVPWAAKQMWAPDAAFKDGRYYLYFPARDKEGRFMIGAAVSSTPLGPFKAEPKPIPGAYSIDPCVFPDDDGSSYMYFGGMWGGQLQCWEKGRFDPTVPRAPSPEEDAVCPKVAKLGADMLSFEAPPRDLVILDEKGNRLKEVDKTRRFFEGSWMHKYRGTYYFSYSTGDAHTLVYATSDNPLGPFTFRGTILSPVIGWTTQNSIIEYKGKWYLYYHDSSLSGGASSRRCVKVQELFYGADGSIKPLEP